MRLRCWVVPGLAMFIAVAVVLQAQARQFDFDERVLDNGLTVVTLEDFSAPIVTVNVWYRVGSKDERPDRQGFAHMFEHMMFRGTDLLEPNEHAALINRVGGRSNAFTFFDYTAYVNQAPANQLELMLWLEAERMMFLNVDQPNFDAERMVVEEERRQDLNEPYGTFWERLMPHFFEQHPYRWLPIGQISHLRAAELEELRGFWDTYYVPANAVLVIVGAVPHEAAHQLAERYFGWIPPLPDPPRVGIREPERALGREVVMPEPFGPVPRVRYMYRGVPKDHPDALILDVLMDIIGNGDSSRLYEDLVKTRQIAQETYAGQMALEQDGVFGLGATLQPAAAGGAEPEALRARMAAIEEALDEHIERLLDEPVSQRELDKVKNQMRRSLVTNTLTTWTAARTVGEAWIYHGGVEPLNRRLDEIAAITVADVQRVAARYLAPELRLAVRVLPDPGFSYDPDALPLPELDDAHRFASSNHKADITRPDWYPLEPPMQPLIEEMPELGGRQTRLRNGLRVVVVPNDKAPFVTLTLGLKSGAWTEAPEYPGAASMALSMLTKGTENYTASELAEHIEYNAIDLQGAASMDVAEVEASALSDKFAAAIEVLAEVVLRPVFPESEFEILKRQRLTAMADLEQDPSYIAARQLRREVYGDHPYARSATGELEDIERLTIAQARAWWETFARPEDAVLYIAGDVSRREAVRLARRHFGTWRNDTAKPEVAPPLRPERQPTKVLVVDRPGSVQSQIRMGQVSVTRGEPYYHEARLFEEIFGLGSESRLYRTVRAERGLTYAVFGYFSPQRFSGDFNVMTFTRTESTGAAVQAVFDVIESMRSEPATDRELADAISYKVGRFAGELETPQDAVRYLWLIEYNDLPDDFLTQALDGYKNTDFDDLAYIADEVIDPERLTIVVVGDAAAVRPQLDEIAPVSVVEPAGTGGEHADDEPEALSEAAAF